MGRQRRLLSIHLVRHLAAIAMAVGLAIPGPARAANDIGVATKVVRDALARSINKHLKSGDGLAFNEVVATGRESALQVRFNDATTLTLGEDAEIILDSMVYQPNTGVIKGTFRVLSGVLRFKASDVDLDMTIKTPSGTIGVRGTEFDLLTTPTATEIAMLEGVVEVTSAAGTQTVSAGQTYRVSGATAGYLAAPSAALKKASSRMLSLISGSAATQAAASAAPTPATTAAATAGGDNRLVMELAGGPVVIELLENLAPKHAERMRALARAGAFDGLRFQFVKRGYVAETAAPKGATQAIAAELSAQPFTRGIVGMSHERNAPDSGTGKFFIALGRAKVLDGKYTAWGKVVSGMEHLDALKPTGGSQPGGLIKSLKLSD